MLLAWKEDFLESKPRSTHPDDTLRALDSLPAPPAEIRKANAQAPNNGQAGHRRQNLKSRLLGRRNIKTFSTNSSAAASTEIRSVSGKVPHLITLKGQEDTAATHPALQLRQSGDVVIVSPPPTLLGADCDPLQTLPDARRLKSIPDTVAVPSSTLPIIYATPQDLSALPTTSNAIQPNLLKDSPSALTPGTPAHTLPTTFSSKSCSDILLPLKCIGPECYIALDTPVEEKLQLKSNLLLQKKLRSFLKSLKLKDPAVVIDCVAASTTSERSQLKATILFLCLDSDQQKIISSSLKQLNSKDLEVVPVSSYQYAVLVQDTRFCSSSCGFPSCPGPLSGRKVEAILHNDLSLCQASCKLSDASVDSRCTLGGLVVFEGSAYALTTSHAFLGRNASFKSTQEPASRCNS
jgi:hypothetical protein